VDALAAIRAAHDGGKRWTGVDVFARTHMDALRAGVVEPLAVKTQALSAAVEVAVMILRIDDVIAAGRDNA